MFALVMTDQHHLTSHHRCVTWPHHPIIPWHCQYLKRVCSNWSVWQPSLSSPPLMDHLSLLHRGSRWLANGKYYKRANRNKSQTKLWLCPDFEMPWWICMVAVACHDNDINLQQKKYVLFIVKSKIWSHDKICFSIHYSCPMSSDNNSHSHHSPTRSCIATP